MIQSKQWNWAAVTKNSDAKGWMEPSEECYYLAERWRQRGYRNVLDLGCGLGRHAIYFARKGFRVSALDLSQYGVDHLKKWACGEGLNVRAVAADMLDMPFDDSSFDCLLAYHSMHHTDGAGIRRVISGIGRVLRPGGECYLTIASMDNPAYSDPANTVVDGNVRVKTQGIEAGIPHFYASEDDIRTLFSGFEILTLRHVVDITPEWTSPHYFMLARKPEIAADEEPAPARGESSLRSG